MSNRSIVLVMRAEVGGLVTGARQAAKAVEDVGTAAVDTGKRTAAGLDSAQKRAHAFSDAYSKALDERKVRAFDLAGVAMVGTLALATTKAAGFEKSLSLVRAVSGASADEMDRLSQAALDAGKDTVFSASESADAIAELSKAGVSTADILGGALRGSLDLAAAGGLGLAEAATIAAQSMNTFGLAGRDVTHIADVLAAGANKSAADVDTLAQAMRQGGLVAKQTGLSLEDTAGVLSLFADNALVGSDAGTSLKTMLQRLTPQSKEAQRAFDSLGISAYDAQGNFVGIDKFAGQLHDRLKDLSPQARNAALSVMFGSDAVRAAAVLYEAGAEGVREYVDAVDDTGAASRMAAEMTDNLAGDIERLSGAIETGLIKGGSGANQVLRWMTQRAETLADAVSELPAPILATGFGVTGLAGGFLLLAPRIMATVEALKAMTAVTGKAGLLKNLAVGGVGAAGFALFASIAMGALSSKHDMEELHTEAQKLRDLLDRPLDKRGMLSDDMAKQLQNLHGQGQIISKDFGSFAGILGNIQDGFAAAFSGDSLNPLLNMDLAAQRLHDDFAAGEQQIASYQAMLGDLASRMGTTGSQAKRLADEAYAAGVSFTGSYHDQAAAVEEWARTTNAGNQSVQMSMAETANAATHMSDVLLGAFGLLDERAKRRAFQSSIDAATDALKKNGRTLDQNTPKGRANADALDDIARKSLDLATTKTKEGEVIVSNAKALERGRTAYINAATSMGLNRRAAERLADEVFGTTDEIKALNDELAKIPKKKKTDVEVDTAQASRAIDDLKAKLKTLPSGDIHILGPTGGGILTKASGGPVVGPGTGTSDDVPIWASNGEYVVRASSVDKYGLAFFDAINEGRFAAGGAVSRRRAKLEAARGVLAKLGERGQTALDYGRDVRGSILDFASLSGVAYDASAAADALGRQKTAALELANAQDRLAKIQAAMDRALSPQARAIAAQEEAKAKSALAAATDQLAAANRDVAATQPNATTYLAKQTADVATAERFVRDVKRLRNLGLRADVIESIIAKGPDEGGQIAAALAAGGVGAIKQANANQRRATAAGRELADLASRSRYGLGTAAAQGLVDNRVQIHQGAFVFHFGDGVNSKTRREIQQDVDRAVTKAVRELQGAGKGGKRGNR